MNEMWHKPPTSEFSSLFAFIAGLNTKIAIPIRIAALDLWNFIILKCILTQKKSRNKTRTYLAT